MDYKEKYEMALEGVQEILSSGQDSIKMSLLKLRLQGFFPELAESEDERMSKYLIKYFEANKDELSKGFKWNGITVEECIAWLEKQGEQKSSDKVTPKFQVGDWITNDNLVGKIDEIHEWGYHTYFGDYCADVSDTENWHKWTIQDAKDGDVLHVSSFSSDCIFIFDKLDNWILDEPNGEKTVATGHCCLTLSADKMEFGIQGPDCIEVDTVKPATKIQRDLLFKTMADAGYTFDFEKKELKEVKQEKTMHNKLTDFESSLKHIMEEAIECGDTRNLKIDADMLLRFAQKSAWSEEDEKGLSDALWCCKQVASIAKDENDMGNIWYAERWLKSLKDKMQPQSK